MSKRKSLKPYQLFLIGLILLLPSVFHLLPSMYAGILVWFALLFWVIAIITAIKNLTHRAKSPTKKSESTDNESPEEFARRIAKTAAVGFLAYREQSPNKPKEELYLQAMRLKHDYSPNQYSEIIEESKHVEGGLTLRSAIANLAVFDYVTEYGMRNVSQDAAKRIIQTVYSVIPSDIETRK